MFRKILLACSNTDLREFLLDAMKKLTDSGESPSEIPVAGDAAAARAMLKASDSSGGEAGPHFDLAAIELHLPLERHSMPDRSRPIGLDLARELNATEPRIATILLVDTLDIRILKQCQSLPCCELLMADYDLSSGLQAALKRLSRLSACAPAGAERDIAPAAKEQPAVATIEIDLPYGQDMTYQISGRRDTEQLTLPPQVLAVQWDGLHFLAEFSRALHDNKDWEKILESIGRQLCDIINRGDFARHFSFTKGWCGGSLENVHIRFSIPPQLHGVAFEALYDKDGGKDGYLMLNAPVVRRVRGFRKSRQLRLESDRPINILVVDANVADFDRIGGPDDRTLQDFLLHYRFDSLSNTAKERGYFEDLRGRLDHDSRLRQSIGEIRVLPNDGTGGACLADAIRHELSGRAGHTYDIVHFAGHSIFVPDSLGGEGRGFLILPGPPDPEALPIGEFAGWLGKAGTQFVYLSSCRSSEADAAYELAGNCVPAVVGFRWDIEDDRAAEYAREFYKQLLVECPAFDEAFLRTRRLMFQRYRRNDRIWAAPMLILQPQDWHRYSRSVVAMPGDDRLGVGASAIELPTARFDPGSHFWQ